MSRVSFDLAYTGPFDPPYAAVEAALLQFVPGLHTLSGLLTIDPVHLYVKIECATGIVRKDTSEFYVDVDKYVLDVVNTSPHIPPNRVLLVPRA